MLNNIEFLPNDTTYKIDVSKLHIIVIKKLPTLYNCSKLGFPLLS